MIFHISNTKLLDLGETSVSFFVFMLPVDPVFCLFFSFPPSPGKGERGVALLIGMFVLENWNNSLDIFANQIILTIFAT